MCSTSRTGRCAAVFPARQRAYRQARHNPDYAVRRRTWQGRATDAWDGFGNLLLARAGKSRARASASAQTSQLGYSTVGHFFYGILKGASAEKTLAAVSDAFAAARLPVGYYLIDSWWYRESQTPRSDGGIEIGYGGTFRWDDVVARSSSMFPSVLSTMRARLGKPFAMHMGAWVGRRNAADAGPPPYAANRTYEWTVEENASIPTPGTEGAARFWDWLFSSMASNGLATVPPPPLETTGSVPVRLTLTLCFGSTSLTTRSSRCH